MELMMIKYLYGKKEYLLPVYEGKCGPRFSNLAHYRTLENEKIRDEETQKSFSVDRQNVVIEINGRTLNPNDMSRDPIFSVPSRNCYCLCLSSKKNDPGMYERFEADFCIAANVDILVDYLNSLFEFSLPKHRLLVKHQSVKYYEEYFDLGLLSPEEVVFFKPEIFHIEAEYRIAIFSDAENKGFNAEAVVLPFTPTDESQHLSFYNNQPVDFWRDIFIDSYEQ
jgi:hypothetical protein